MTNHCSIATPRCKAPNENQPITGVGHESINKFLSTNQPAIGHLVRGEFVIRTLQQAEKLATMLAHHCPNASDAAVGIWELLANAIEHGSYEIDFDTKSRLLLSGEYRRELKARAIDPRYGGRCVKVGFRRTLRTITIRIEDQGPGFDYAMVIGAGFATDKPNGRGIALARKITFTEVRYLGRGNVVVATIRSATPMRLDCPRPLPR